MLAAFNHPPGDPTEPWSPNNALIEVYAARMAALTVQLNYLAMQHNIYNCNEPEPTPDYDDYYLGDSDYYWWYSAGEPEYCYDELWEVDISYDGGATWSTLGVFSVSHCSGGGEYII
jgi:hypothetical protein